MDKQKVIKEVWEDEIAYAKSEFKQNVRIILMEIEKYATLLNNAKKRLADMEFVEPKMPEL